MRIKKLKRVAAAFLSAVLAIGAIPVIGSLTANAADPEVTNTVNFDLSGISLTEKADGSGYEDLAISETTLLGDVPVLATASKTVKIQASSGVVNENGKEYTKRLSLGGTGNTTYRAVKLVLPTSSEVTVWALSGGASDRTLNVSDGTNVIETITAAANTNTTVNGKTVELAAGTYYIFSAGSGINIYDIDIQWSLGFGMSEFTLTEKADGSGFEDLVISETTLLGDVPVLATASKTVKIQASSGVANENGYEYTKRLSLGGTGNTTYRAVKIELPHSAEVTVWALSGGASDRTLNVSDGTNVIETITAAANTNTTVNGKTVELAAGTYYIFSAGSGINIFDIKAKYSPRFDLSGLDVADITANVTAGDFELIANSSSKMAIQASEGVSSDTGVAFTKKLSLGGSGNTGKRAIKFTLAYRTSLDIYALSGGATTRTLNVSDGTKVVCPITVAVKDTTTINAASVTLNPGTYYIYSAGSGINVFDIKLKPDKTVCSWDEVETPSITDVTVNEQNGNFVVNFTGSVDRYDGAQYIMISMQSNGAEVSSYKVVDKVKSVEMTPYWDGDYSFTITAMRSGEAHKVGNTVKVDNFKLRLRAPVFRMFESIGGGKVYIDWIDNEYADSYSVYYKLASDSDDAYSLVTDSLTDGKAVLSDLTVGSTYTIKVVAKNSESGLSSSYAKDILVTENAADKQWYAASTGSNQTVNMTITTADGTTKVHSFSVKDESKDKTQFGESFSIANTTGKINIAAADDGKISDDEDGFRYYYTMIDPNKENFKLTATFKITDISRTPDNQTGFGIIATDILGVNQFGTGSYVHKYFNSILMGHYSSKNANATFKYVTGYGSADASIAEGVERSNNLKKFKDTIEYKEGNTYTFTLEKTNEKFIGTFNGETIELDDTAILSAQEDGSICVGVFSARKVGVEITDIKFSTSESTGVTGGVKDDRITPDTRIYSTDTVGSNTYELIYASNVPGLLTVTGPDSKVYDSVNMAADSVARVNVTVATGSNTINTVFIPSKDAKLTSYSNIEKSITVTRKTIGAENGAIYVSPDAKTDGKGTKADPMSLSEAVKYARPGQVIVMTDGEYTKSVKIPRSVSGTADKMITLMAENTGKAVFTEGAGLGVEGSYWHVYGINTVKAAGVGIQVYGNYNIIEMCVVQGSGNSGIQISRSGSATNSQGINGLLWPSYNLIKNCESFDNCDAGRNDADGFAAKLTCGEGNRFYGCISHNNIDDGWDLYAKTVSGEIGAVVIENCVAYDNGWLTTEPGNYTSEGNGFKLGGGYLNGGHILKNSIAFNNAGKGITSNSCPDIEIYNCISYNNQIGGGKVYNVGLNAKASAHKPWVVSGLISMNNEKITQTADLISFALHSKTNFIYDGQVSFNVDGVIAENSWFVSTDVSKKPTRNENGTINMAGLLELTEEIRTTYANVGAFLDVTSDKAISVAPAIPSDGAIILTGEDKDAIVDVEKSEDLVLTDKDGNVVSPSEQIYVEIAEADQTVIDKFKEVLKNNSVSLDGKKAEFFNIELKDMNGNKITVKNGKIYVTLAYPEGTTKDGYKFTVYHLNGDNLEVVPIECTDKGIVMEATAFSPYAIVYEESKSGIVDTPITGDVNNAIPFVLVMIACVLLSAALLLGRKRRTIKEL